MIIMKGLPASGKSTKAKELVEKYQPCVRLNKDLLRTMLHYDMWSGPKERNTRDASRELAKYFLSNSVNVVIDDTNLNPSTVQSWVDLAKENNAKIEYCDLTNVDVRECLFRDAGRTKPVGYSVIIKMALQHLGFMKDNEVIISDLDGTLCDINHRKHYVQGTKKDWKGFFNDIAKDRLRHDVRTKILDIKAGRPLILVSARPEEYRDVTESWLNYYGIDYFVLIMRESGDKREDSEVKKEIYNKYLKHLKIVKIFDDRPRVIRMWRELGLDVEDVGDGIEF